MEKKNTDRILMKIPSAAKTPTSPAGNLTLSQECRSSSNQHHQSPLAAREAQGFFYRRKTFSSDLIGGIRPAHAIQTHPTATIFCWVACSPKWEPERALQRWHLIWLLALPPSHPTLIINLQASLYAWYINYLSMHLFLACSIQT